MSFVKAANNWTSNAELILDVARLGYIRETDKVLDPTFGRGIWWQKFRPNDLSTHDIAIDGVDFRNLPYEANTFDVVAYDPPYVCVSLDTQIFTQRGWLHWEEVVVGDFAYTLNHESGAASWQKIEEVIVQQGAPREMISMEGSAHSSLTTPDHRWPVVTRNGTRRWANSATFRVDDVVPLSATDEDLPQNPIYSDAFVELVAWFWTEGTIEKQRDGRLSAYGNICQSNTANGPNVERIRFAFRGAFGDPVATFPRRGRVTDGVPRWRECTDGQKQVFWFSVDLGRELLDAAPNLVVSYDFLSALTRSQLELFIQTSIDADGGRTDEGVATLGQKRRDMAVAFQMAAIMAGYATSLRPDKSKGWVVRLRKSAFFKPSRNRPVSVGSLAPVWCVRVPNETWLAMRNGTVYFTGNCVGGRSTTSIPDFHDRYGMTNAPKSPAELQQLINDGLTEMQRVVKERGLILCKCQDYVSSGKLWIGTHWTLTHAYRLGLTLVDRLEHIGKARAQPTGKWVETDGKEPVWVPRRQQHARRNLSTLFVFQKQRGTNARNA